MGEEVLANLVPAAAVIREGRALFEITGRKGRDRLDIINNS